METAVNTRFSFGNFEIDTRRRLLLKNGEKINLNPKTLDLLLVLIEREGKIISKDELLDRVWADQFVEENNLTVHIAALRKALGEKKGEHRYIVTNPGRGYTFVAALQPIEFQEKSIDADYEKPLVKSPEAESDFSNTKQTFAGGNGKSASGLPAGDNSGGLINLQNSFQLTSKNNRETGEFLIGREKEIAEIKLLLLGEHRLVTLTGTGGTGKTRLAQAAAFELTTNFPDGVFFVELAAVRNAELVAPVVVQILGIKESADQSSFEALKIFLRQRRILLVLDNFEQLISAAPLVRELLAASANLKILITSRAALRLESENQFAVTPLALPPPESGISIENLSGYPAISLFVVRAQSAKPNFILTEENAPVIADICRRLDGLPLAIELAAARIKLLSPQAILGRLENSLKFLTGGAKDLPERRQTMRGAIEWSYDLLDENEQRLFRRLAIFAGGFAVEAAEAICENHELQITGEVSEEHAIQNAAADFEVLDLLGSLIDNNLLTQKEQPDGNTRLGMLEVVREFAFECLSLSDETDFLRQAHARFFLALAEEAEPHLLGEKSVEWLERLETEHDNLRAAFQWALEKDAETAMRIAAALRYFWANHSHLTEGRRNLEAALENSDQVASITYFKLLNGLGQFARYQNDIETARKVYEKALTAGAAANELEQVGIAKHGLAALAVLKGDFAEAQKFNEEELSIFREINHESGIAYALSSLGDLALARGDMSSARGLIEGSLEIFRKLGNKQVVSINLANLGIVAYHEQNYETAYTHFAESLSLSQKLGNKSVISCSLDGFAALAERRGDVEQAAVLAGAAEQLRESIGFEKEPAELRFCETYITKVRAVLDENTFLTIFEKGREMNLQEAVAVVTRKPQGGYAADGHNEDIIIESHSYSRILIEENIVEEIEDEIPPEKTILLRPDLEHSESRINAAAFILYFILGAILVVLLAALLF